LNLLYFNASFVSHLSDGPNISLLFSIKHMYAKSQSADADDILNIFTLERQINS